MNIYILILILIFMACMKTEKYPNPKRDDQFDNYHGTEVHDPYRWMEDLNHPDLKNWIKAENKLTQSVLDTIPEKEILTRTAFRWFGRMNAQQVLESDTFVGKQLLINCDCK